MIDLAVLLILGFASYRVTRFFVLDTLLEGTRQKLFVWLVNRKRAKGFFNKILELFSCTFCAGFWVTLLITSLYFSEFPWYFTKLQWISSLGVTGVQAFIHTLESGDE